MPFSERSANCGLGSASATLKVGALDSAPPAVTAALRTRPILEAAESGGDWQPDDAALRRITGKNRDALKAAADGGTVLLRAGGLLVLMGDDQFTDAQVYVVRQEDFEEGSITVTKGGAFSKGGLRVAGISAKQDLVRSAAQEVSDKKVSFA